jgi:lysophospholipase L1-like esterase
MTKNFILISLFLFISVMSHATPARVVFMGDSITENWMTENPVFFEGKSYVNRGISGETTEDMLKRFESDVLQLEPTSVVILAGTNDIAENGGPVGNQQIMENIAAMAKMAQDHKINVVLCSLLPVYNYPWRPGLNPPKKILALNLLIKNYADENDHIYVDYYSAMVDDKKGLNAEYTEDGVHPTLAGYKKMEPLVEEAISKSQKNNF